MTMHRKLKLRVIQLDLARQMETIAYIKEFINFAVKNGYNMLALYLEGRVRTEVFPYPLPNESYSQEEMQELVKYATQKGIEIIPIFSFISHAELFLQHKELEHLAELREGKAGRFSNNKSAFCPSLDETYTFIDKYISDIVQIFPSKYIHVGCDEAWDIGICNICKDRGDGHLGIFLKHLNTLHQIVSEKYKKKMIIWDDLLENYPEALPQIHNNIILCSWHYDNLVDIPKAHFGNRLRIDKFAEYDRLGFQYFLAPSIHSYRNAETFTEYACKYNPLGGWMTVFELGQRFLYYSYPIIAYAGKLWSGGYLGNKSVDLFESMISEIFRIKDAKFIKAAKAIYNFRRLGYQLGTIHNNFLTGIFTEEEAINITFEEAVFEVIKDYAQKNKTSLQKNIYEDILIRFEMDLQSARLRKLLPALVNPENSKQIKRKLINTHLEPIIKKFKEIKKRRKIQWEKHRPKIKPCNTDKYFDGIIETISEFKKIKNTGILNVYFFLPEFHSSQKTAFYIKYKENVGWEKIIEGIYKQHPCTNAYYIRSFTISGSKTPEAIRIETWGYGGQGLTFLEVKNKQGTFVPTAISNMNGIIEHPSYILAPDDKWCFMGEKDTRREFLFPSMAKAIHTMDILLGSR